MAVTIRKKLLFTFAFLVLLSIACQIVFNLFFAKSFFIYRKTDLMEKSYDKLKEAYQDDLNEISLLIEDLQDDYGIKVSLLINDRVLYTPGYTGEGKRQTINKQVFDEVDFSYTPKTIIRQPQNDQNGRTNLQLSGMFKSGDDEIKVLMRLSIRSIDNSISLLTETSIYISLIVLLIGVIFSVRVSKTLSDPIYSVELVSKKITMLDFSHEADESVRIKELSSLAKNINIMSEELQNTMEQLKTVNNELQSDIQRQKEIEQMRKDFIANVSHEMKTPLSLLQVYTENLRNDLSEIDRNYYYDTILEETEKLNQMVSRMIEISSIDSGFLKMNFEEFSMTDLCRGVLQQYHLIFENYKLDTKISEDVKIFGDPKYLEHSVKNLLNNAAEHTDTGGVIKVSLEKEEDLAVFTVQNQGEKITEDGLLHAWDAFYRDDRSRTRTEHNNIGLGLYIVKTIIGKHQGTCDIRNVSNGVAVSFRLQTKQ